MFDRVLKRMRERVRGRQYVMTLHAEDEMEADGLTIYDVESVILTGQIVEGQRDYASAERKYVVSGMALSDEAVSVVAKFGPTSNLVFITVFRE